VAPPSETRRALVTGLTGQDGSFLAELLLDRGYEVTGVIRREAAAPLGSSEHLRSRV
jgi:GDPmannose 4,6-dehydratase